MTRVCFILLFLLTVKAGEAQVAVIDGKKLVSSMPVFARIDTLVAAEQSKYQNEYNALQQKALPVITMADSLNKKNPMDSAALYYVKQAQAWQQALTNYAQQANTKITEYRTVLTTPYIEKINAAIKKVARIFRYKQVIDIQQVSLTWYEASSDITNSVIKELGNER